MLSRRLSLLALLLACAFNVIAAEGDEGFPLPAGARRNVALGGATTLPTGKNYTIVVYEVDSPLATVRDFYASQLREAPQTTEGDEVRFSMRGGTVRLARFGAGTRITLTTGPR
jgi:hypothetical protein